MKILIFSLVFLTAFLTCIKFSNSEEYSPKCVYVSSTGNIVEIGSSDVSRFQNFSSYTIVEIEQNQMDSFTKEDWVDGRIKYSTTTNTLEYKGSEYDAQLAQNKIVNKTISLMRELNTLTEMEATASDGPVKDEITSRKNKVQQQIDALSQ